MRTKWCRTDFGSIFINGKRLDNEKSTKLLDRVLLRDLVLDRDALGGDLDGIGKT